MPNSVDTAVFTIDGVRLILGAILKDRQTPPGRLETKMLVHTLNQLHGVYAFAAETGNAAKSTRDDAQAALSTLGSYFESRRRACLRNAESRPSSEVVEKEKALYAHFQSLVEALQEHTYDLDMDVALLMPRLNQWRQVAALVADAFIIAMKRTNPDLLLGLSNDGPVARFVAATLPAITGDAPSVQNVAKCLKDRAREAQKRMRTVLH